MQKKISIAFDPTVLFENNTVLISDKVFLLEFNDSHRIIQVERNLWRSSIPTLCSKQRFGLSNQIGLFCNIYKGRDCPQPLQETSLSVSPSSQGKSFFLLSNDITHVCCPLSHHCVASRRIRFHQPSHQMIVDRSMISCQLSLLKVWSHQWHVEENHLQLASCTLPNKAWEAVRMHYLALLQYSE